MGILFFALGLFNVRHHLLSMVPTFHNTFSSRLLALLMKVRIYSC